MARVALSSLKKRFQVVGLAAVLGLAATAAGAKSSPGRLPPDDEPVLSNLSYVVRYDHWTEADERAFGEFITGIGDSGCRTVDACLSRTGKSVPGKRPRRHPFQIGLRRPALLSAGLFRLEARTPTFRLWETAVSPLGRSDDIRYSPQGNEVTHRHTVTTGSTTGPELLNTVRDAISSAMYRIDPAPRDARSS